MEKWPCLPLGLLQKFKVEAKETKGAHGDKGDIGVHKILYWLVFGAKEVS